MGIQVIKNGESIELELGILKEINQNIAVFSVKGQEIKISVDDNTKQSLLDMDSENTSFAIDLAMKEVVFDFDDPELDFNHKQ